MGNRIKSPTLDLLHDERIFSVTLSEDKKDIEFEEECDNWFSQTLSKSDLGVLIEEFKSIYDKMLD